MNNEFETEIKLNKPREKKNSEENQDNIHPASQDLSNAKDAHLTEIRHEQIVEGACKVFFSKGYHPSTIRDIATACNMSMGQLYHYVHSKDDILYLVNKKMQKIFYEYISRNETEKIKDPVKKLHQAIWQGLQFMVDNKELALFIYTEAKNLQKEHLQTILETNSKYVLGYYRELLGEIKNQEISEADLDILAGITFYLISFIAVQSYTVRHIVKEDVLNFLYNFILKGLEGVGIYK